MDKLEQLLHECKWQEVINFDSKHLNEQDYQNSLVKQLYHINTELNYQKAQYALVFYKSYAELQDKQIQQQLEYSLVSEQASTIVQPEYPLALLLLWCRQQINTSQLQKLYLIRSHLMKHIAKFDLYTDSYFKFYLIKTNELIYESLLALNMPREAFAQLQVLNQFQPLETQQQYFRLCSNLGYKTDPPVQSSNFELQRTINEAIVPLFEDEKVDLFREGVFGAEELLKGILAERKDKNSRTIISENIAVLQLMQGKVQQAAETAKSGEGSVAEKMKAAGLK
ncbi:Hypothetical_protein [Hexamita inflata]|uniref:Hypothetical_protein n=1 Tax=Hexamita inflata TaxID=28002 RepID=A0AA86U0W8_9EUKA|nr:Hypothetical protein HINF_LOCUS23626 [Hexamita inflata]